MGPPTNVDGERSVLTEAVRAYDASMGPPTNVDGERSRPRSHATKPVRFNGAADKRRRRVR